MKKDPPEFGTEVSMSILKKDVSEGCFYTSLVGEKVQAPWWRWRKMKQKSIYVTVRVNPHVPGPMETRNKKLAKNEAATTRTNDMA